MNGGTITGNKLGTNFNSAVFQLVRSSNKATVNGDTVNSNGHNFAYVSSALSQIVVGAAANVDGNVAGFGIGPVDVNSLK